MTSLYRIGARDPRFRAWLRLTAREWPWVAAVALAKLTRRGNGVWVLAEDGEVVAGALLTRRPANVFRHRNQRALARQLCHEGRLNLSYFAVRHDLRGQGHGQRFVSAVSEQRPLWLACEPALDRFYRGCGLVQSSRDPRFHLSA